MRQSATIAGLLGGLIGALGLVAACQDAPEVDLKAAEREISMYLAERFGEKPDSVECEQPTESGTESIMTCQVTPPKGGYRDEDALGNVTRVSARSIVSVVGTVEGDDIAWDYGLLH
ncbi:MAG: DUF4333 domain-containing protein [Propionibacteriales bacterium]|nr:DUF4333 domain-containing protein [Propionibacteriales bacterium]